MRTSKWINRLLSIAVLCCILFVSLHFLGKALTPTSASNYFNHDVKEAVEDGENVELVFIGASRMARSFIPSVIKEEMDLDADDHLIELFKNAVEEVSAKEAEA